MNHCLKLVLIFLLFSAILFSYAQNNQANSVLNDSISRKIIPHKPSSLSKDLQSRIDDTVNIYKIKNKLFKDSLRNSPKSAALLGVAFPGLGQIYNKKYWKLPIVYAGIGGCIFWLSRQTSYTKQYNQFIILKSDTIPDSGNLALTSLDRLIAQRNIYRRNVQIASFVTVLVWGFTILDAAVDAHLKPFDISDNLSLQVKPTLKKNNINDSYLALSINLGFK